MNTSDQRGASDSKNLTPTPILMAQNQMSQTTSTEINRRTDDGGTSIVTGKVTDARTGANLKGAKVTIEETGQWTSTNDLGEFRFINVPIGSATLTVSYLGYAGQSAVVGVRGDAVSQSFALRGGSELEEIIVYGTRSARAQSLNLERSGENSRTVLAADFLGQFDGTTISEALRRAPGVAFEQSDVTGDGTNIIVRGLEPDLNQVSLNGLRLADGTGVGRSADLSNILTESISSITINKTLLPSQDSYGTGGLVEIETKSPLDRARRFASLSLEGAERDNGFGDEFLVSGTVSGTFGPSDQFGLSASLQFREQEANRLSFSATQSQTLIGSYLPVNAEGLPVRNPLDAVDPEMLFPFDSGNDRIYPSSSFTSANGSRSENLSLTITGEWQVTNNTNWRLDYFQTEDTLNSFTRSVRSGTVTGTELLPIDELGGEERFAIVTEDFLTQFGFPPGVFFGVSRNYRGIYDQENNASSLSFRGATNHDRWSFEYAVGFSEAETLTPLSTSLTVNPVSSVGIFLNPDFISDEMAANTILGRIVSPFPSLSDSDAFVLPLINEAGFDFYNDPANVALSSGQVTTGSRGRNERTSFNASIRRDFDISFIDYVELGVFYEDAEFKDAQIGELERFTFRSNVPLSSIGLDLSANDFSNIGIDTGFGVSSQSAIDAFFADRGANIQANDDFTISPFLPLDPRLNDRITQEENTAFYLQSRLEFGKLEIVGGLRVDVIDLNSRNLISPLLVDEFGAADPVFQQEFSRLVDQEASQTEVLPRVTATYRQSENMLFRFGYGRTVARPQIANLSREQNIFVDLRPTSGPSGNQPSISVRQGNPNLKPAITDSFDLSAEYYFQNAGQIKASLFYKTTDNSLELNTVGGSTNFGAVTLPDDPRLADVSDFFFTLLTPINNEESADIWGVELAFERQFTTLPSPFGGLGIYSNYTYTNSSKVQPISFFSSITGQTEERNVEDVRFSGDPEHSGTAALTYNKYGVDASLAYTRQGRRLSSYRFFGLSEYAEEDDSLDFRLEYQFEKVGGNWQFWFEGADLLRGSSDPDVITSIGGESGVPTYRTAANYFGGREFRLGMRTTF